MRRIGRRAGYVNTGKDAAAPSLAAEFLHAVIMVAA
jgi:hypothetical protein